MQERGRPCARSILIRAGGGDPCTKRRRHDQAAGGRRRRMGTASDGIRAGSGQLGVVKAVSAKRNSALQPGSGQLIGALDPAAFAHRMDLTRRSAAHAPDLQTGAGFGRDDDRADRGFAADAVCDRGHVRTPRSGLTRRRCSTRAASSKWAARATCTRARRPLPGRSSSARRRADEPAATGRRRHRRQRCRQRLARCSAGPAAGEHPARRPGQCRHGTGQ